LETTHMPEAEAALPDKPRLPLQAYLPKLTDGNASLFAVLDVADIKEVISRCDEVLRREENVKAFDEIYANTEWDSAKRSTKASLLISKLYLQALKPLGFKAGVDCKKCLGEFEAYKYSDKFSDEDKQTVEALLKEHREAAKPADPVAYDLHVSSEANRKRLEANPPPPFRGC